VVFVNLPKRGRRGRDGERQMRNPGILGHFLAFELGIQINKSALLTQVKDYLHIFVDILNINVHPRLVMKNATVISV